jgi:hypothetical protein
VGTFGVLRSGVPSDGFRSVLPGRGAFRGRFAATQRLAQSFSAGTLGACRVAGLVNNAAASTVAAHGRGDERQAIHASVA